MSEAVIQAVRAAAAEIVQRHGADLEDVTIRRAGRRSVAVVVVDADGGIQLDTIAEISSQLSAVLDESEALDATPYTLEVTSPGVSRPLTLPRHWRRAKDRLVRVTMMDGSSVTGRVIDSDDTLAQLRVAGAVSPIPYADVTKAVVQVEFPKEAR